MSRRFQFSLRALIAAMLVVAAFFGGVHFERERVERERLRLSRDARQKEISRLMARFNVLMDKQRNRSKEVFPWIAPEPSQVAP
jgi:hypothetical protein